MVGTHEGWDIRTKYIACIAGVSLQEARGSRYQDIRLYGRGFTRWFSYSKVKNIV